MTIEVKGKEKEKETVKDKETKICMIWEMNEIANRNSNVGSASEACLSVIMTQLYGSCWCNGP